FQRSHHNDDLLHEKRIPPRKIARNGVSCRISGTDEEPPLGMFDEKAKDRHGSHPLGIAEDVDLPLKCRSSLLPALLGSFQLRRACLNGCDVDHQSLQTTNNRLLGYPCRDLHEMDRIASMGSSFDHRGRPKTDDGARTIPDMSCCGTESSGPRVRCRQARAPARTSARVRSPRCPALPKRRSASPAS